MPLRNQQRLIARAQTKSAQESCTGLCILLLPRLSQDIIEGFYLQHRRSRTARPTTAIMAEPKQNEAGKQRLGEPPSSNA